MVLFIDLQAVLFWTHYRIERHLQGYIGLYDENKEIDIPEVPL